MGTAIDDRVLDCVRACIQRDRAAPVVPSPTTPHDAASAKCQAAVGISGYDISASVGGLAVVDVVVGPEGE